MTNALLKPEVMEVEELGPTTARLILRPLERGFGYTIGNALRRILLSSMEGAAISKAEIAGVDHEYSTIEGMREDVIDVLLNLKGVAVALDTGADEAVLQLDCKGPCTVTADQIRISHNAQVKNPDHVIAHLDDRGKLKASLYITRGRGYVPATRSLRGGEKSTDDANRLLLDASYSPIRRVAYAVEKTRVEQRTDMDKLVLELETNGTVSPRDAVRSAAHILQEQISVFLTENEDVPVGMDPVFLKPIEYLELNTRALNSLKKMEILYCGDLAVSTEHDLLRTPNLGKKSVDEIKACMAEKGMELGTQLPGWPPAGLKRSTGQEELAAGQSSAAGSS